MRSAAARISSIVGVAVIAARRSASASAEQCYAQPMNKTFFALAAALLSSAAQADTLIDNVNGIQIGADGKLQRFKAIVIGDDGKVRQLLEHPELVRLA